MNSGLGEALNGQQAEVDITAGLDPRGLKCEDVAFAAGAEESLALPTSPDVPMEV